MNNLNKLSNIWNVQEKLSFRERDRELSKRLSVLRSEYSKNENPKLGGPLLVHRTKDVSTQTDTFQKSKWKKFFKNEWRFKRFE